MNTADVIVNTLKAMPRRQRDVLILHRFERWSLSRIASHLRLRPEAVEGALSGALWRLSKALEAAASRAQQG